MFSFREFANKLSLALLSNSNIPLQKLDLSHNPLEDKGECPECWLGGRCCRWWAALRVIAAATVPDTNYD